MNGLFLGAAGDALLSFHFNPRCLCGERAKPIGSITKKRPDYVKLDKPQEESKGEPYPKPQEGQNFASKRDNDHA
jgi:hypothetical protein